jgi:hypothetical protein
MSVPPPLWELDPSKFEPDWWVWLKVILIVVALLMLAGGLFALSR